MLPPSLGSTRLRIPSPRAVPSRTARLFGPALFRLPPIPVGPASQGTPHCRIQCRALAPVGDFLSPSGAAVSNAGPFPHACSRLPSTSLATEPRRHERVQVRSLHPADLFVMPSKRRYSRHGHLTMLARKTGTSAPSAPPRECSSSHRGPPGPAESDEGSTNTRRTFRTRKVPIHRANRTPDPAISCRLMSPSCRNRDTSRRPRY